MRITEDRRVNIRDASVSELESILFGLIAFEGYSDLQLCEFLPGMEYPYFQYTGTRLLLKGELGQPHYRACNIRLIVWL